MKRLRRPWAIILMLIVLEALLPPGDFKLPEVGASRHDWNADSYWHNHWGVSGVHKGIDIFARRGTPVVAAQSGLVLFSGRLELGGNVVLVITPRGWLHYYAHLDRADAKAGDWRSAGEPVGTVGDTGDAAGRPPHLHYAVLTLIPRPWATRPVEQGWKRMFYRNPDRLLAAQTTARIR